MENTIVFGLSSSQELAQKICEELNMPLGKSKTNHFADGEILLNWEKVFEENMFISFRVSRIERSELFVYSAFLFRWQIECIKPALCTQGFIRACIRSYCTFRSFTYNRISQHFKLF